MPINKVALIRYKTIDRCLRDKSRNWTLDDLIEACFNAVKEATGINKGSSKRTIQADLQLMRDENMGYNAPIKVIQKKYYTYTNDKYSISKQAMSKQDAGMILDVVDFLKQLQTFEHFKPYDHLVKELEAIVINEPFISDIEQKPESNSNGQTKQIFENAGHIIQSSIYSTEELMLIQQMLQQFFYQKTINENGEPFSINEFEGLHRCLINPNLQYLLKQIDANASLVFARYYKQLPQANWFTTLHQNIMVSFKEKKAVEGFSGWLKKDGITSAMAPIALLRQFYSVFIPLNDIDTKLAILQIIPGSHKKILSIQERNLMMDSIHTQQDFIPVGGVHLVKPLLLQAFDKINSTLPCEFVQLDFCSYTLPDGLAWIE